MLLSASYTGHVLKFVTSSTLTVFYEKLCLKCFSFLCRCDFYKMNWVGFLILLILILFCLSCKGKISYSHFYGFYFNSLFLFMRVSKIELYLHIDHIDLLQVSLCHPIDIIFFVYPHQPWTLCDNKVKSDFFHGQSSFVIKIVGILLTHFTFCKDFQQNNL